MVNSLLAQIDWDAWIFNVGPDPTGTLQAAFANQPSTDAINLANAYINLNGTGSPANYTDYNTWFSGQQVVFHQTLIAAIGTTMNNGIMTKID